MNRKELITVLNDLEQKYPVDEWQIGDIYVWPILKIDIFFKWFHKQNTPTSGPAKLQERQGKIKKVGKKLISFFNISVLFLRPKAKVSILFSGASSHRVEFKGKFINRYFQPLIEYYSEKRDQSSLIIDYLPKDYTKNYSPTRFSFFLEKYKRAAYSLFNLKRQNLECELKNFQNFIEEANVRLAENFNYNDYISILKRNVQEIKVNAQIFDIFLRRYNPKTVVGLCYYSNEMYGLNYAAYNRGRTSIDMQHGGQGDLHPAYSSFNKVPEKGYNVLPMIFWCWDHDSAIVIESWVRKQSFHKVVIGGNPWVDYAKRNNVNFNFPDKKIILYTLQFSKLDEYILNAIVNTTPEYQWWIRLHPRKLSEKDVVYSQLKEKKIEKLVNIDNATEWPLPVILSNCAVHISMYSGSVIEAEQLGVPNIIIHEVGADSYQQMIKEGKAFVLLEHDEKKLLKLIYALSQEKNSKEVDGPDLKFQIILDNII
jgi:hypothetical protein